MQEEARRGVLMRRMREGGEKVSGDEKEARRGVVLRRSREGES